MDRVDDMSQDIVKYNNYSRSLSKQQQQKHQVSNVPLRLTVANYKSIQFLKNSLVFGFASHVAQL